MSLRYVLADKQVSEEGDNHRVTYTCRVLNELDAVVLEETVSGAVNWQSSTWADGVAQQIADGINVVMTRAERQETMEKKTDRLADKIATLQAGE